MELFNFLNSEKYENLSFDLIFEKAANDPAFRPLFYRKLLESELFLLTYPTDAIPQGKSITDKKTKIKVRFFKTGVIPIFTSRSRIFDGGIIKGQVNYTALKASVIFQLFDNKTAFILNPYSNISKELLPEEIGLMKSGNLFGSGEVQEILPNENILIGVPAIFSINLVETLKRYFETRPEIKGAYLALINNKSINDSPHLLLGIDSLKGTWKEISSELMEIARPYLQENEVIDFLDLSEKGELSILVNAKELKIY
jgi:hypothetical protein